MVHLATTLQKKYVKIRSDMTPTERDSDTETPDKIRRIRRLVINTENMRIPFRTIHSSMTRQQNGGLSKLFVPVKATNAILWTGRNCDRSDGTIGSSLRGI